jgi:hypothetical protein
VFGPLSDIAQHPDEQFFGVIDGHKMFLICVP